ncbi:unnamed protein product [Toxocara canis]|uniref:ABC transporter domain-containing protein n=1 Tax=Toxocara canis TaxID=6265 RepID=A0A3P7G0H0_TOXCA|nr:unnamed protein product [Toxocara canis]
MVGPSGSGKSTVISLLERFYDPPSGIIKLDNYEVKCLPMVELREQIALVGQEPVLFGGTIRENILLGVENKSNEDVIEACEMANARQFIEAMPNVSRAAYASLNIALLNFFLLSKRRFYVIDIGDRNRPNFD